MVSGHLRARGSYWHMIVSFRDENGKRIYHSRSTGLKVKGNKHKAEEMLNEYRRNWTNELQFRKRTKGIYLDNYLIDWLDKIRPTVSQVTYSGYSNYIHHAVVPYFKPLNLSLSEVTSAHISSYYDQLMLRGISPNTVRRIHANIHKALECAVTEGLIAYNCADRIKLPSVQRYNASYYSADECKRLFDAVKGTSIDLPVHLAVFLGLRRSELLALQWDAVDFERHTIRIFRSVHQLNGEIIECNTLKRKSSYRTLPMPKEIEDLLLLQPRKHSYVCLSESEKPITPNALSTKFRNALKKNGLRHIRFHDLRHTCAALLISSRVPMYEVSKWMGHSTISITYDLYGHIEFENKIKCASVLSDVLKKE